MRVIGVSLCFVISMGALAQEPPSPDAAVMARLVALEKRVRELESEIARLRDAPGPASPRSPAVPVPTEPATAAVPPAPPSSGAKVFNPDIGIIGNFIGAFGNPGIGTDTIAPLPSLTLQESEASYQAVVDPFARADFFLAFGEEGVEVEEGYATFTSLPGDLLVKAGKMRASFGRLNLFHNHTLPWVDRPIVMYNLLGGSTDDPDTGIKDAGVSVSRLLPLGKLYVEAVAELFRGDSGSLFQASRRRDVSFVGHLKSYADLSDDANLELGLSYARGRNDQGSDFATRLYGMDATFRWKPLRRALYRSLVGRAEAVISEREEPAGTLRAFGMFASLDYQLARRWFAGLRYDWSERARDPDRSDRGASAVLTFWPSEFTQVRGQYRSTSYASEGDTNELLLQVLFTIGAHGAHPF